MYIIYILTFAVISFHLCAFIACVTFLAGCPEAERAPRRGPPLPLPLPF